MVYTSALAKTKHCTKTQISLRQKHCCQITQYKCVTVASSTSN